MPADELKKQSAGHDLTADPVPLVPKDWHDKKKGELTSDQRAREEEILKQLEGWQGGYVEAGKYLLELTGAETGTPLWSGGYENIADYCRDTLGLKRSKVYRLMQAAKVAEVLIEEGHSPPRNENMAVALYGLSGNQMLTVWEHVLALPGRPTIKKIAEVRADGYPKRKYTRKNGGDQPLSPFVKWVGKTRKLLDETIDGVPGMKLDKAGKAELRKLVDELDGDLKRLRELTD